MKIGENEGMAEIWASDFDNGSSHPCGYPVLLSFTPVSVNAAGQMVGTRTRSMTVIISVRKM
ncbi:MAG: hypothetical protein IPP49_15620 [Saprospiraceae bacterium]|nr:hypothetical protein [Saprospiraceae bacterium]